MMQNCVYNTCWVRHTEGESQTQTFISVTTKLLTTFIVYNNKFYWIHIEKLIIEHSKTNQSAELLSKKCQKPQKFSNFPLKSPISSIRTCSFSNWIIRTTKSIKRLKNWLLKKNGHIHLGTKQIKVKWCWRIYGHGINGFELKLIWFYKKAERHDTWFGV